MQIPYPATAKIAAVSRRVCRCRSMLTPPQRGLWQRHCMAFLLWPTARRAMDAAAEEGRTGSCTPGLHQRDGGPAVHAAVGRSFSVRAVPP
jgi:hypothetical protein